MSSTATPLVPIVAVSAAIPLILALRGHSLSEIPSSLLRAFSLDGPGSTWKILALVFALLNIKGLPFVWHLRVFSALAQHLYIRPKKPTPALLFKTHTLHSRSPALECDYNIHKSNSTYFADLDISRTHVVSSVLRHSIFETARLTELPAPSPSGSSPVPGSNPSNGSVPASSPPPSTVPAKGKFAIALGAVAAVFRAEIAPYQPYEIRSRILTWDRKWVYIISHFVQPTPAQGFWPLLLGRRNNRRTDSPAKPRKIYASAIGKYVFKKGRLTVPPELVLQKGGLLPEKPVSVSAEPSGLASVSTPATPADPSAASSTSNLNGTIEGAVLQLSTESAEAILDASLEPGPGFEPETKSGSDEQGKNSKGEGEGEEEWTYARIEAERVRGLRVVEAFSALDALQNVDLDV